MTGCLADSYAFQLCSTQRKSYLASWTRSGAVTRLRSGWSDFLCLWYMFGC